MTVPPGSSRNLVYATVSLALGFAAWGLVSAFASTFKTELNLSAQSTALLVAVPILLGSLARVPMGMLTDRYGGRLMFSVLFALTACAAAVVPSATTYAQLLAAGFFLGIAGSSFAIGAGFVSRWFPPQSQGTALAPDDRSGWIVAEAAVD